MLYFTFKFLRTDTMKSSYFNTRIFTYAIFSIMMLFLSSCSYMSDLMPDEIDEADSWSASKLYEEAKYSLNAANYPDAVRLYEKLQARFPHGVYAQQAQLEAAYAYYKDKNPTSAIATLDRFIKVHPKHRYVDYAYYLRGLTVFPDRKNLFEYAWPQDESQRDPRASMESFQYFEILVRKFPNSIYAQDSLLRMRYLKNKLAKHELHIAKFYFDKQAYVAAVNRASYIVSNLQETPSVGAALLLMVDAYKKLNLNDLAADTQKVYEHNKATAGFVDDVFPHQDSILPDFLTKWFKP